MSEQPIACSLDGAGLEARLAAATEVGRAGLISRELVGERHLLRFRPESHVRARLEEIVKAERECCPFLSISLEERGSELVLAIEVPVGAEEPADALAAAFTGAQA